jgi:hypothetical protein
VHVVHKNEKSQILLEIPTVQKLRFLRLGKMASRFRPELAAWAVFPAASLPF